MDKKEILSNAAAEIKAGTKAGKKTEFFSRAWMWIKRQAVAAWTWIKNADKLMFCNILLLFLVCALLLVMFGNVRGSKKNTAKKQDNGYTLTERTGVTDMTRRLGRPNRPTMIVSRKPRIRKNVVSAAVMGDPVTVTLPIRRPVQKIQFANKQYGGTLLVDGKGRKVRLDPMTDVDGDLILQNMRAFTLPCGTRINGNLILRNVKMLKFCGCFEVVGNIYVSGDSAFGPIPRDAYLGGQVIF